MANQSSAPLLVMVAPQESPVLKSLFHQICTGRTQEVKTSLKNNNLNLGEGRQLDKSTVLHCLVFSSWLYRAGQSLEVLNLLLNYSNGQYKEILLTSKDIEGKTPLHLAAEYKKFRLANTILSEMNEGPNFNEDLTPLHLLSDGRNLNAVETMKKMLEIKPRFKGSNSEEVLKKVFKECARISATHSAKHLLKYFLKEKGTNTLDPDHNGFNLFHYCMRGFGDDSVECLNILLEHISVVTIREKHSFDAMGGYNILKAACELKNAKIVNAMLPLDQRAPERSFDLFTMDTRVLIYSKVPAVLHHYIDSSVTKRMRVDSIQHNVNINFRAIFSKDEDGVSPDFKQTRPLAAVASTTTGTSKDIRSQIFLHPVTKLYVQAKWKCFMVPFLIIWIIIQIFLTVSFNILVVHIVLSSDVDQSCFSNRSTIPKTNEGSNDIESSEMELMAIITVSILLPSGFLVLLKEIIQMRRMWTYLANPRNYVQLFVLFAAAIVSICSFAKPRDRYENNVFHVWIFGVGSLFSCVLFTVDMGRILGFQKYSELLMKVSKTSLKILCYYAPLFVGFSILFMVQFHLGETFKLPRGLIKILAMTIGDLDYNGLEEKMQAGPAWSHIFFFLSFLSFVVIVGIALINVLIGLALVDLEDLLKHAKCREQEAKILLISECEDFLDSVAKLLLRLPERIKCRGIVNFMKQSYILEETLVTTMEHLPPSLRPEIINLLKVTSKSRIQ